MEPDTDEHGSKRMDTDERKMARDSSVLAVKAGDLTEAIIGAAFAVANELGHGFLEKVYCAALEKEMADRGIAYHREAALSVSYKGEIIGTYNADFLVAGQVIVELKAVERLSENHVGQVLNYLRASGLGIGLLLNFGTPRVEVRRVVL